MQTAVNSDEAPALVGVTVNDPNITDGAEHDTVGINCTETPGSPGTYDYSAGYAGAVRALLSGVPDGAHTYQVTFGAVSIPDGSLSVLFPGGNLTALTSGNPGPYTITGGTPSLARLGVTGSGNSAQITGPITLVRTA